MNDIFSEKSITVIDEVGGLKWLIYGPPTLQCYTMLWTPSPMTFPQSSHQSRNQIAMPGCFIFVIWG